MTRKELMAAVKPLTFVSVVWKNGYDEYRVAYRGLKPDRAEAMAYYTDDEEDALGTANTMEHHYWLHVLESDKLPATLMRDRLLNETRKEAFNG